MIYTSFYGAFFQVFGLLVLRAVINYGGSFDVLCYD